MSTIRRSTVADVRPKSVSNPSPHTHIVRHPPSISRQTSGQKGRKAASPSCHTSRRRMDSSDLDPYLVFHVTLYLELFIAWMHGVLLTARRYASVVYAVVMCPSVRPSVTRRCCTKTAKHKITLTTPYDSPGTLVFWCEKFRQNFNGVTLNGAPNRGGVGSDRPFSTNISLYFNKKLSYHRGTARCVMLVN